MSSVSKKNKPLRDVCILSNKLPSEILKHINSYIKSYFKIPEIFWDHLSTNHRLRNAQLEFDLAKDPWFESGLARDLFKRRKSNEEILEGSIIQLLMEI